MPASTEGHSILSNRPGGRTTVLLTSVDNEGRPRYRWKGEARYHTSQADAYDAAGLPPDQAPQPRPAPTGDTLRDNAPAS